MVQAVQKVHINCLCSSQKCFVIKFAGKKLLLLVLSQKLLRMLHEHVSVVLKISLLQRLLQVHQGQVNFPKLNVVLLNVLCWLGTAGVHLRVPGERPGQGRLEAAPGEQRGRGGTWLLQLTGGRRQTSHRTLYS